MQARDLYGVSAPGTCWEESYLIPDARSNDPSYRVAVRDSIQFRKGGDRRAQMPAVTTVFCGTHATFLGAMTLALDQLAGCPAWVPYVFRLTDLMAALSRREVFAGAGIACARAVVLQVKGADAVRIVQEGSYSDVEVVVDVEDVEGAATSPTPWLRILACLGAAAAAALAAGVVFG